jgi:hypothetical protein
MTVFIEVSQPFLAKPGRYTSRIMYRFWWGWFAVGILRIPFREFNENSYRWEARGDSVHS